LMGFDLRPYSEINEPQTSVHVHVGPLWFVSVQGLVLGCCGHGNEHSEKIRIAAINHSVLYMLWSFIATCLGSNI
jgi:hypothetical protein